MNVPLDSQLDAANVNAILVAVQLRYDAMTVQAKPDVPAPK